VCGAEVGVGDAVVPSWRTLRSNIVAAGGELDGIHVLVIDFDDHVLGAVRRLLEPSGAFVTTTPAARANEVTLLADVIVCDLELVEAAGSRFLETLRLKHTRRGRPAPALAFVTGGTPPGPRVQAAGFDDYVTKPIDSYAFRRAIQELARK
jgi:CheY-like chemotaxis protein